MRKLLLPLSILILSCASVTHAQDRLISPYDVSAARKKWPASLVAPVASVKCTALVSPVIDFNIESRYDSSDPTASTVDPAQEAAYDALVAPVQLFSSRVAKAADQFVLSQNLNKSYADCALAHLYSWANASALLGDLNNVGFLVTSSAVASASAAYLKIKSAYPSATATSSELAKLKVIRTWLRNQGESLSTHYANVAGKTGLNNQRYTSGMAIGLASIATQNHDHFAAAMKSLHVGLNAINTTNGFLPLELARGSRALSYHFVAAGPMAIMMELASFNGEVITAKDRTQMSRLVNFIYKSYKDPTSMRAFEPTLPAQEMGFECNDFAFLEVNAYTTAKTGTPNATLLNFVRKQRASCGDLYSSPFGGDLSFLFGL
jgi:poly(beta-D-mannuronate) lyase